jgi:energy-coupling factor transporter ATP-binding protein EcfA2
MSSTVLLQMDAVLAFHSVVCEDEAPTVSQTCPPNHRTALFASYSAEHRGVSPMSAILPSASTLYQSLTQVIAAHQLVFIVGLPGVGKSLLVQQLAVMAHHAGRQVHVLQWDVARQPFVSHPYVAVRYPEVDGVTHAVVRKAVGLWARAAIGPWWRRCAPSGDILIAELPLIGNRCVELVQRHDDGEERILTSAATRFLVPVPSREVRRLIEGRREARSLQPLHERERDDAQPHVLQAAWRELYDLAHVLGIASVPASDRVTYDPDVYQRVYSELVRHRPAQILPVSLHLPTDQQSVYELAIPYDELVAEADEVHRYVTSVEQRYPDRRALDDAMSRWYLL